MEHTFTLTVNTTGDHSEQELIDFIEFSLGGGGLQPDNAFINEDSNAGITNIGVL